MLQINKTIFVLEVYKVNFNELLKEKERYDTSSIVYSI